MLLRQRVPDAAPDRFLVLHECVESVVGRFFLHQLVHGASALSTYGFTSPIISSIERIPALCGLLTSFNEKHTCTGLVRLTSAAVFSATGSASPVNRLS